MKAHESAHEKSSHTHGAGTRMDPAAEGILARGLEELLRLTDGMEYRPLGSEIYPFPLTRAVYAEMPSPEKVCADVRSRLRSDPVSVLEYALALLELHECNQPDIAAYFLADMPFIGTCFNSKRCNGWIALMGAMDRAAMEAAINRRWQFKFFSGRPAPSAGQPPPTGVYILLSMLARYGFVYGRIPFGDVHALSHFVEEFTPGLIVAHGPMDDLELTLSLAAMKMGVPAVVPAAYPFPLGRSIRTDDIEGVIQAVTVFPNIRKLLPMPELPPWPDYCDPQNQKQEFQPSLTWGGTPESFCIVRKGRVESSAVRVRGRAPVDASGGSIGIAVTIQAEPMDAFDRRYIESNMVSALSMIRGVRARLDGDSFAMDLAKEIDLDPEQIGQTLLVAIRREWPRLERIRVEVILDPAELKQAAPLARAEKAQRAREIASATEENADRFYQCVGCSPFAPDHVCCLTPERAPQCARPYEMIKTGAQYGYDDVTNIHHSALHREINSFRIVEKGRCLDPVHGEWEGLNAGAAKLSRGRTTRVRLHSLEGFPHTGCGCFRMIMFKTDLPRPGIGIMNAGYGGRAPDGRTWRDLHYALAGKQTAGLAGAAPSYLRSPKFLKAHGGWRSVVWVTPKIAAAAGDALPKGVEVGPEDG
jgi:acetyl-CoA decarbonylase/synthase complex subunit beta